MKNIRKLIFLGLFLLAILPMNVLALDFNESISEEDQETFDQILAPVIKIYNLIKYSATVLAVLFLVLAGFNFVTSGGDQGQRERSKSMATYIFIGLIVIWIAPLAVNFLV